jgi:hypothetical protein
LRDATSRIKETTAPQRFLSSRYNTHRNAFKTADNSSIGKKCASRTLSRDFWQQKYFLENLVLARSSLAAENFFDPFCESDSQNDSTPRDAFADGAAAARAHRDLENGKRNDRTTRGGNAVRVRHPRINGCSDAELGLEQVVHSLRVHLAAG